MPVNKIITMMSDQYVSKMKEIKVRKRTQRENKSEGLKINLVFNE